jgi:hypothetical protein
VRYLEQEETKCIFCSRGNLCNIDEACAITFPSQQGGPNSDAGKETNVKHEQPRAVESFTQTGLRKTQASLFLLFLFLKSGARFRLMLLVLLDEDLD